MRLVIAILLVTFLFYPACESSRRISIDHLWPTANLEPAYWGTGELKKYLAMDDREFPDNPMAEGIKGAITTSYHAVAARAGLEALEQGGSSVDAAMTAALTQVTLNAGAVVSFFGIINMVHYDAASGEMVSMDASWNTVQNEKNPNSIPAPNLLGGAEAMFEDRQVSGRTALVGGFMKGLEEAHQRYGNLLFRHLFEPAIYLAENGFKLSTNTADFFKHRDAQIRRLPETRATLVKSNGKGYKAGDVFKQPALAKTLKKIAKEGSDYMYNGPWGERAVEAIQADGGKMTLQDLADYEVIWNEPVTEQFGDYVVSVLGPPVMGSVNLIEALNLAYAARIPQSEHWSNNGESLKKISDVTSMFGLGYLPEMTRKMIYPDLELSDESRIKKETATALWKAIEGGKRLAQYAHKAPKHSDTVVAIDQWGNMTAVTHSINCVVWGNEAIVVDGISIGDPASFQQRQIESAGPGNRLPSPIEAGIISKNGIPIIPFASMATGLHQQTVQSVLNIIAFDMDVKEAVDAPGIFLPSMDYSNLMAPKATIQVMEGAFPKSVLEESGLPYKELPASERRYNQGLWIGIEKDPVTGKLRAASPPYSTGCALAF